MNALHFSDLKKMALSPAHFRHSETSSFEQTRSMLVGTAVHTLVLGSRPGQIVIKWSGERKGNAWKEFEEAHPGAEILNAKEWAEAEVIAEAVLRDPVAKEYLRGRFEHAMKWDEDGVACETDGIDVLVENDYILDLKTTQSAQPDRFKKLALNMLYPQQMAFYERGCRANGISIPRGSFILGVETSPPFLVTVLDLTPDLIQFGERSCLKWLEHLRNCRENNFWPGYSQSAVPFDVPMWATPSDDDGEEVAA